MEKPQAHENQDAVGLPTVNGVGAELVGMVAEVGLLPVFDKETGEPIYGIPTQEGVVPFDTGQLEELDKVDRQFHLVSGGAPRETFQTADLHRQSVAYRARRVGQGAAGATVRRSMTA